MFKRQVEILKVDCFLRMLNADVIYTYQLSKSLEEMLQDTRSGVCRPCWLLTSESLLRCWTLSPGFIYCSPPVAFTIVREICDVRRRPFGVLIGLIYYINYDFYDCFLYLNIAFWKTIHELWFKKLIFFLKIVSKFILIS